MRHHEGGSAAQLLTQTMIFSSTMRSTNEVHPRSPSFLTAALITAATSCASNDTFSTSKGSDHNAKDVLYLC